MPYLLAMRLLVPPLIALAALALAPLARADDGIALDRSWSSARLDPDRTVLNWNVFVTGAGAGRGVTVYSVSRSPSRPLIRARIAQTGGAVVTQDLATDSFDPALAGSAAGGAVATWNHEATGEVEVAELLPGAERFGPPIGVETLTWNNPGPEVAVSDQGAAAVLYLAPAADGSGVELRALVRPAGGAFGTPEVVASSPVADDLSAADVDVGPDGTIVAGFRLGGRPVVAVRSPGGGWSPPQNVSDTGLPLWRPPRVGVDAAGNVAAAWSEGPRDPYSAPVRVAFRPAGGTFGASLATGIEVGETDKLLVGVSDPGELFLLVDASTSNPSGGGQVEGLHALFGNTRLGRIGSEATLAAAGHYPSMGMNRRGDAVVVWDECCNGTLTLRARRRLPYAGFGPAVDVQPPIPLTGPMNGRWTLDASVDEFGEARAAWVDTNPQPHDVETGEDAPLVTTPLATPAASDAIPSVLGGPSVTPPAPPPPKVPVPKPPKPAQPVLPKLPKFPPRPPGRATKRDRTAPTVQVVSVRKLSAGPTPRIVVKLRCSEACGVRPQTKLRKDVEFGPLDAVVPAGTKRTVVLPLTRGVIRTAWLVYGKAKRAKLTTVAIDASGNVGRRSFNVEFPR